MDKKGIAALARQGRGEDSVLVHMAPAELAGLQQLAKSHGLSLTINPKTGLPEAGILSALLPAMAGAAAMYFTGGAAAPWMGALAGGATSYMQNPNRGIVGALPGALAGYGGAGLMSGVAGAGGAAASELAAEKAAEAQLSAALDTSGGLNAMGSSGIESGMLGETSAAALDPYASGASAVPVGPSVAAPDPYSGVTLKNGLMALAPAIIEQPTLQGNPAGAGTAVGSARPATYHQARNPRWGEPGQPYFLQAYGQPYAQGGAVPGAGGNGIAAAHAAGGKLLKGPGTGLSDSIPATINGKQPARLADGEFVVSSDVVSALGGGSTESGAKKLYGMMDRVRKQAHGHKKQIKKVSDKVLPA